MSSPSGEDFVFLIQEDCHFEKLIIESQYFDVGFLVWPFFIIHPKRLLYSMSLAFPSSFAIYLRIYALLSHIFDPFPSTSSLKEGYKSYWKL